MRPKSVSLSAVAFSAPIPLDYAAQNFQVGLGVDYTTAGTATYTVQMTFDDIYAAGYNPATGNWQSVTGLSAQTAAAAVNSTIPVRAVRLNITSYVSGTIRLTVIQASSLG